MLCLGSGKGPGLWKIIRRPAAWAASAMLSSPSVPSGEAILWGRTAWQFQQDAYQLQHSSLSSSRTAQATCRDAPCRACQRPGAPGTPDSGVRGVQGWPRAHLLDILLGPAVRGMHNCPHHFHVATDNQGFVRCVCVYSHSTMTDNSFWNLSSLP